MSDAVSIASARLKGSPLEREEPGLEACVHCGFCLTACPTYLNLEDENDSPRGRLVLMRGILEGDIATTDPVATTHLDRCLGCRACETVCPSGVPYGHILEAARETIAKSRPLPWRARAILYVFAHQPLLRIALAFARAFRATGIPRLLARIPVDAFFPFAMLASTARSGATTTPHPIPNTPSAPRGSAALLTGCVMEGLFAPVNRATERALANNGYGLVSAPAQQCCGALHTHAGDADAARVLARKNIAAFEESGAEWIAVNSAGCGAMLKEYTHLLATDDEWRGRAASFSARVKDVSELLAVAGPRPNSSAPVRVAYDAPCHLQHAQRVTAPPLKVLGSITGVTLVPLAGNDQCCGSAGIFNLIEPDVASRVLAPKLVAIAESGAEIVATGNPGCLMQIGGGLLREGRATVARHPVELMGEPT